MILFLSRSHATVEDKPWRTWERRRNLIYLFPLFPCLYLSRQVRQAGVWKDLKSLDSRQEHSGMTNVLGFSLFNFITL
jgi:hypothetical protein